MWRRPTIRGIMAMVLVSGLVLGCFVDSLRIRRAQARFRQQATHFAELEKLERLKASDCLDMALYYKQSCELDKAMLDRARRPEDCYFPNSEVIGLEKSIDDAFAYGKQELHDADRARSRAQKYASLSQAYAKAASSLWLPFAPRPWAAVPPTVNAGIPGRVPAEPTDAQQVAPTRSRPSPWGSPAPRELPEAGPWS
jgi:hypothetical protein